MHGRPESKNQAESRESQNVPLAVTRLAPLLRTPGGGATRTKHPPACIASVCPGNLSYLASAQR
jgi:hypothetical protein